MSVHRFEPRVYHTSIGTHAPVLTIASGSTVITTTVDARGMDATGKQVPERGNPQTGPFFVEGAEPGDMLSVTFDRLRRNRKFGWSASAITTNLLEPESRQQVPNEAPA